MERKGQVTDYLKLIPPDILTKLEPFRGRLDEVLQQQPDFSHLKYHVLDALFLLRYVDKTSEENIRFLRRAINFHDYPYPEHLDQNRLIHDLNQPTFSRIEKALELHDLGKGFESLVGLKPNEHHFGSLFIATVVNGDPRVCEAVFHHIDDVLPKNISLEARLTRDIDRLAGSGYIGLIRLAEFAGFKHSMLEERDEDKIINDGIMMSADRYGHFNESKAKDFFWKHVYPFYKSQGGKGLERLATSSKIILDRLIGRNFKGQSNHHFFEEEVLKVDGGARKVEPVIDELRRNLCQKFTNTLEVLIITRRALFKKYNLDYYNDRSSFFQDVLLPEELKRLGFDTFLLDIKDLLQYI
ncbi:MAG TPA: hypothetical protein VI795_01305 [Patescibacteria group bacterium]|nr:hypothetical protein [Patescibacteria group bacterium]